jgi:hypothetical protein
VPDAHTSNRRTVRGVELTTGDEIRVEGKADGEEYAGIDYLELVTVTE